MPLGRSRENLNTGPTVLTHGLPYEPSLNCKPKTVRQFATFRVNRARYAPAFNLLNVATRALRPGNYARNFSGGPLGHVKVERSAQLGTFLPNDFAFSAETTVRPRHRSTMKKDATARLDSTRSRIHASMMPVRIHGRARSRDRPRWDWPAVAILARRSASYAATRRPGDLVGYQQ